jgi:hypothetical protein
MREVLCGLFFQRATMSPTMKTKLSLLLSIAALAALPLPAQTKVETVLAEAITTPKNAVALIGWAALEAPESAPQLAAAAFAALPEQSIDIVRALLKAAPAQATGIVRAAITAQPDKAFDIASAAITTLPAQSAEILKTAVESAPESTRAKVATLTPVQEANASRTTRATTPFPTQPIRPDIVSPSS